MKKFKSIFSAVICAAVVASSLTLVSFAEEDIVYGTMDIPYDEFYAAEGVGSEVDAVASATTSLWKNPSFTTGTYTHENEDGTGVILGVTYPVAISRSDLSALGSDNYNFTELKDAPGAYKTVTVSSGKADFSKVSGNTAAISGVESSISADTPWGDYLIEVTAINNSGGTSDIGTIYGVLLFTEDGDGYAMRHLQNLWRDEIAWSSGFTTTEPHGSKLDYADYVSLMGKTITEIRYITDSGYHSLSTSLYVPVKFNGSITAANGSSGNGSVKITAEGFPSDFGKTYSIEGLDAEISDDSVNYKNAMPGQYTLSVSDSTGVYAGLDTTFTLSTDEMPAAFDGEKLVKADGVTDEDFKNFLKCLSNVNVNGTDYAASGRTAITIIKEDGTIDYTAEAGGRGEKTPIFNGGEYSFTVTSAGYNKTLSFTAIQTSNGNAPSSNPGTGVSVVASASSAALISAFAMLLFKKRR